MRLFRPIKLIPPALFISLISPSMGWVVAGATSGPVRSETKRKPRRIDLSIGTCL